MRTYLETERPARLAYIADYVAETIQRYTLIHRIKLARGISSFSTENKMIKDLGPTDKVAATLKEAVANDKSGVLERYVGLTTAAGIPFNDSIDINVMRTFGPGELLAGPSKKQKVSTKSFPIFAWPAKTRTSAAGLNGADNE